MSTNTFTNERDGAVYKSFEQIIRNGLHTKIAESENKIILLTTEGTCSFITDSREKMNLNKKSPQIKPKSCDFILNPATEELKQLETA